MRNHYKIIHINKQLLQKKQQKICRVAHLPYDLYQIETQLLNYVINFESHVDSRRKQMTTRRAFNLFTFHPKLHKHILDTRV